MQFNPDLYYFPINDKTLKPLKGWQKASTNDIDKINEWKKRWPRCLFGVDCGKSKITVLDIDKKNGKDGDEPLAALQLENELIPDTFTVSTPSGGRHLYFHGETKNRVALKAPGLDVRSVGGYVIAPGCKKNGKPYEIVKDKMIHNAPGWLLTTIGTPNERKADADKPVGDYDLPHNVQKAIDYLSDDAPEANAGERDVTCYKVACRVRDFGISLDTCQELMVDYYAGKVQVDEDFATETMAEKVNSAYQYANDRPGNDSYEAAALVAAEAFSGITGEELPDNEAFEEALPESQWTSLGDFLKSPAPEREWIVEGWLPAGFSTPTLIAGDGGTGKSLLAMMLAISVAQGTSWLGNRVARPMRVAMIMCEDSKDELHRRVEAINASALGAFSDLKNANVDFMSRVGKDCVLCREDSGVLRDGPFMKELHTQLKHLGDEEKLLILDTVADIYAGNESNRTSVNQFIKHKLCALAKIHNATLVIIAHPPKSGATYSGSTAWNNSVRNRLFLGWKDDKNKDDWRVLSVEKSNYARAGTKICLRWDDGTFTPMEVADLHEGIDELVFAHIESFNFRAQEVGDDGRLSARPQSKKFIGREIIMNPVSGKRIGVGEIKESVARLIEAGRIAEVRGRTKGLVCLTDYSGAW